MATSSIFRDIILKSEEDVTNLVDAMEKSQQDAVSNVAVDVEYIEDEQTLRAFLDRVMSASE